MYPSRPDSRILAPEDHLTVRVLVQVLGISTCYAAALSYLERRYPIKPDHIWAEVAGGVLISLVPTALAARHARHLDWRLYEGTIWRSFIASGTPIILWQLGEAILRQMELLDYTSARELKNADTYAYATPSLALRSGDRA